ncbi:MAG: nucleotidyltransferase family protein [Actinomycetota bacterium]
MPTPPSALPTSAVDRLLRLDEETGRRELVRALLRLSAGLPAEASVEVDDAAPARRLAEMADRHRIGGLLWRAIETGVVRLESTASEQVRADATRANLATMQIDQAALRLHRLAAGIDVGMLYLKGVATRRLDHADESDRSYVDVDVLVDADAHDRLVDALLVGGYRLRSRGPGDGPTFFKGSELHDPVGIPIDLHTRLFRQSDPRHDGAIDDRAPFELGGEQLTAPSAPWRLVHAAGHLVFTPRHERKMNASVDVVRLVAAETDLDEAFAIAGRLGVRAAVAWGIHLATSVAGVEVDVSLLDHHGSARDLRSRAARLGFLREHRSALAEQPAHLLGLRRRDRPRLVGAFLSPSGVAHLRGRRVPTD